MRKVVKEIVWPDKPGFINFKTKLFVTDIQENILIAAQALIDQKYPFRAGPWGTHIYSIKKREFYLNQYLWFYQEYSRFPVKERLLEDFPNSLSFPVKEYVLTPISWCKETGLSEPDSV